MTEPTDIDEMFARCRRSAMHLGMRDVYSPDDPLYLYWKDGIEMDVLEWWREFYDVMTAITSRGVEVRRARVVSEPVTDFVEFEYDLTEDLNIPSGERVRWLPRRQASDLALPGNDCWVFDNELVRFEFFAGDGTYLGGETTDDPAVVQLCVSAFEAVWERAIEHEDYRP